MNPQIPHLLTYTLLMLLATPSLSNSTTQTERVKPVTTKPVAAEIAVEAFGGRVLRIKQTTIQDSPLYQVRLLLDGGKVKIIHIDPNTGTIVK